MITYKAKYQNPLLPDSIEVDVNLLPNSLIIDVGGGLRHEWFYGMLKTSRNKNGTIRLINGKNKKETLDVPSTEILFEIKKLAPYAELSVLKPWWKVADGLYTLLVTKFGIIFVGIGIYFLLLPFIIDFIINHVSRKTEKDLGNKIESVFVSEASEDTVATALVNQFISELKLTGDYKIHATVLKSKEKNAFALPGGEIIIYDSIFQMMKSYTELVALLGHEIGHIEKKHSMKMLAREGSSFIVLAVVLGNMDNGTSLLFRNANMFHTLSFSRSYEEEADEYSLELMRKAEVNREGMAELFRHLKASAKDEPGIQFISTHPLLESRIEKVEKEIKKGDARSRNHPDMETIFWEIQKKE